MPGGWDYLEDLPHSANLWESVSPEHTLAGWLSPQVGWNDSLGHDRAGLRGMAPGVLYDEITYPFDSAKLLGWLPALGDIETLDFPAEAWWGPGALTGAVHLHPPSVSDKTHGNIFLWAGEGEMWGGVGDYGSPALHLVAADRQSLGNSNFNSLNNGIFLSTIRMCESDSVSLQSTILAAESSSGDNWNMATGTLDWNNADFQSIQFKPYFQEAQSGTQTIREAGSFLAYQVNLAGIVESHFRVNEAYSFQQNTGYFKGSIQNFELVDVIGDLSLDAAFRLDYSDISPSVFSALAGISYPRPPFSFFGDFANGTTAAAHGVDQINIGIQYAPDERLEALGKYVHIDILGNSWDGEKVQVKWRGLYGFWGGLQFVEIQMEEQVFQENGSGIFADFGGKVEINLDKKSSIWARGRVLPPYDFYEEIGADVSVSEFLKLFVEVANIPGNPVSWPDSDLPLGRVFWVGVNLSL